MAQIIDGTLVAAKIKSEVAAQVATLVGRGVRPGLAVVLVGDDPASHSYVRMKEKDCEEVGISSRDFRRPAQTDQAELIDLIDQCNSDATIHGILVQLPLPAHLDEEAVLARISREKDVDGLHPTNLGRLVRGIQAPRAC
ncbi:MAG: tetrahydrofolate dehydrogenase/cyclohydrolase catalytic domain-containing protein, partial [Coriobacteriia bacterium]|nr:tetrahydrofolate dehydrogenase/cyclohydrolase catalytic domain-containing protein [Coriobacteriia bacterium]